MELALVICGTVIVLACLTVVVLACVEIGKTSRDRIASDESLICRMGDKLVANSDYQIERMKLENTTPSAPLRPSPFVSMNGVAEPHEADDVLNIPGRG